MATILMQLDSGSVPIVMGDMPPSAQTPISDRTPTAFTTNLPLIVEEGAYCFGLQTTQPNAPLWQVVQAVDGEQTEIAFRKLPR